MRLARPDPYHPGSSGGGGAVTHILRRAAKVVGVAVLLLMLSVAGASWLNTSGAPVVQGHGGGTVRAGGASGHPHGGDHATAARFAAQRSISGVVAVLISSSVSGRCGAGMTSGGLVPTLAR